MVRSLSRSKHRVGALARLILGIAVNLCFAGTAPANTIDLGGELEFSYKVTATYAASMRLRDPHGMLIDGPIDPLQAEVLPQGQLIGFSHTGLSTTINFDDGNRNFRKGSLINNRISGLGELGLRWRNLGLIYSGSAFYDSVYERSNDNDSPETVNKIGDHDQFTRGARYYNGKRSRTLDAYGYADFELFEFSYLRVSFGKQLVAYGESLFLPGISGAMAPNDATKAFVPGAEVKDILLPVYQAAFSFAAGLDWSFFGFYQLDWKPTEVFASGDLFSVADIVGPGASFAHGSINPAALDGCPGLLGPLSPLCNLGGLGGPLLNAPANINVQRLEDLRPDKDGQFGGGVRYQLTDITNIGAYYLRYHNHNPTVQLNPGFAFIGSVGGVPLTTGLINQFVPVTYNIRYFDDIEMIAGSFTSVVGPFNVAGELIYRDGIDVPVQAVLSGVLSPISTRAKVYSAQVSSIFSTNPRLLGFDEFALVSELKYVYVDEVEAIDAEPGVIPVGDGGQLFNDRNAWAYQALVVLNNRNMIAGWDYRNVVAWAHAANGNASVNGDFGPLFGEGDRRLSLIMGMQYLQNLDFSIGYNMFFGNPRKGVRGSIVRQNPLSDRDFVSLSIKYHF